MQKTDWTPMHSSQRQDWETPPELWARVERHFGPFDLDAAATAKTAKCKRFFTPETNALTRSWDANRVWLNPPYGRSIGSWVQKAWEEAQTKGGPRVAVLTFARTDTVWWHKYAILAEYIVFLKGRVAFLADGQRQASAPAPSVLLCFGPTSSQPPKLAAWDWKNDFAPIGFAGRGRWS